MHATCKRVDFMNESLNFILRNSFNVNNVNKI